MDDNLTAARLLTSLRWAGLTLTVRDAKLWVSPPERITPEQRTAIAGAREALLGIVTAEGGTCLPFRPEPPPAALYGRMPPWPAGRWAGNLSKGEHLGARGSAGFAAHEDDGTLSSPD